MDTGSEGIAANGAGEDNGLGYCVTHHVSSSAQEDCSVSAGEVGEGKGSAEEGGVTS